MGCIKYMYCIRHMHTCTHARTHARTRTHTHTFKRAYTPDVHMHAWRHTHITHTKSTYVLYRYDYKVDIHIQTNKPRCTLTYTACNNIMLTFHFKKTVEEQNDLFHCMEYISHFDEMDRTISEQFCRFCK